MAEEDAGQSEIEAWLGWEVTNSGHYRNKDPSVHLSVFETRGAGWA